MINTEITLSEPIQQAILEISQSTGKSQQELITDALEQMISNYQRKQRLAFMQQAKGIWTDRDDLPSLEQLRNESNRWENK